MLIRNRVPFPLFLMIVGSSSAPKSFLSSISFSKSRRISCLDGG
ncbi:MAG: hypothetical protein ACXWH4_07000 [Candidatus Aminicenantales bacterium]